VRDTKNAYTQFLLYLLIPLHVSASRCHLQGVTVSLFISYSRLYMSICWISLTWLKNVRCNDQDEWIIVVFVGFSRIFLLGILIFKGLTARRLYKSFGVKGLMDKSLKPYRESKDSPVTRLVTTPTSPFKLPFCICLLGYIFRLGIKGNWLGAYEHNEQQSSTRRTV
jgi:hypothetical protein